MRDSTHNGENATTVRNIEISIKGKWFTVPALCLDDNAITVRGRTIRTAVIEAEDWREKDLEDPARCIEILKSSHLHRLKADIFTFTQKPSNPLPRYSYHLEWDSIAAVKTSSFEAWWKLLPQETRKNVRRAQKRGVEVTTRELDEDLCRQLVELNNDSPVRQGKLYTHYGKSLDEVKKDQESFAGRRELICAYVGSELVGFLKLVYRGDVASILHLLPKASHNDKKPANALIAKAVEICEQKGISLLIFGKYNYGNKRESSLREFKTRCGFEEIMAPRYYVPLSARGAILMKVGLHRGVVGVLPHNVITALTKLRAQWYAIKESISRRSSIAEQSNRNRQTECSNPPAGSNT